MWALAAMVTLSGCSLEARRALAMPYQPKNVHSIAPQLPASLRRVAVLPLTTDATGSADEAGVKILESVLLEELNKRKAFEVIPVSREQLRSWTGEPAWKAHDKLPAGLFAKLRESTGCDAVFLSHLTLYRAYPPLAVGWRLALIDVEPPKERWAVDEVFDAGSPEVIKAAEMYFDREANEPSPQMDQSAVLNSPKRFGHYSAHAVLALLPGR